METIIDEIDRHFLNERRWFLNNYGYVVSTATKAEMIYMGLPHKPTFLLHRAILAKVLGRPLSKGEDGDHINGIRTDNRRCNLRIATRAQNLCNKRHQKNNVVGYKGVSKGRQGFYARIYFRKTRYYLGSFPTAQLAAEAYKRKAEELFGEFAHHLNSPP